MTERIWAPWRMQYIRSSPSSGPGAGCVLCSYADQTPSRENGVLVARAGMYVVLNKYPYASAHLMVVPARHVKTLTDLSPAENDALFGLVRDSVACLDAAIRPQGHNVGINLGHAAGAGIEAHLHVHVVPRWAGDNNFMPVIGDVRVMPEYLEETWAYLAPHFAQIGGERS